MNDETKVAAAIVAIFFVGVALIAIGGGLFSPRFGAIFVGTVLTAGAVRLLVAIITNTRR